MKIHIQEKKVKRGCEKRIVPKKERPRVYNELKVFLSLHPPAIKQTHLQ